MSDLIQRQNAEYEESLRNDEIREAREAEAERLARLKGDNEPMKGQIPQATQEEEEEEEEVRLSNAELRAARVAFFSKKGAGDDPSGAPVAPPLQSPAKRKEVEDDAKGEAVVDSANDAVDKKGSLDLLSAEAYQKASKKSPDFVYKVLARLSHTSAPGKEKDGVINISTGDLIERMKKVEEVGGLLTGGGSLALEVRFAKMMLARAIEDALKRAESSKRARTSESWKQTAKRLFDIESKYASVFAAADDGGAMSSLIDALRNLK